MLINRDELLFEEDRAKLCNDIHKPLLQEDKWNILIVDDEEDVHRVTKLTLKRFCFDGKSVRFLSAYSATEAKKILVEQPDIAVILLDVVMEQENAGLELARYIRKELGNKMIRIVLRTGHPGQAPEESVTIDYDINDYREKTELTTQRLMTTVITALRSYRDLSIIDANRRGLKKVIDSSASIFKAQSMSNFASGVLTQLVALLHLQPSALYCQMSNFVAEKRDMEDCFVLAATGNYEKIIGHRLQGAVSAELWEDIQKVFRDKASLYLTNRLIIYCCSKLGVENIIYMEGISHLNEWERNLIEIFSLNVSIAFDNIYLHKQVENAQKEIIYTLGEIAETRSAETGYHVKRVAEIASILATKYGIEAEEAEILRLAASIHDLGKLAIHDSILNKPGKLTPEEFGVMKTHAQIGYDMLRQSNQPVLQTAALIAHQHHEHFDGGGYPLGLKGEEIHIYSRIVALADVFDALGNRRVYKEPWTDDRIVPYICEQRGKQFDPALIDLFLDNLDEISKVREQLPDE